MLYIYIYDISNLRVNKEMSFCITRKYQAMTECDTDLTAEQESGKSNNSHAKEDKVPVATKLSFRREFTFTGI